MNITVTGNDNDNSLLSPLAQEKPRMAEQARKNKRKKGNDNNYKKY